MLRDLYSDIDFSVEVNDYNSLTNTDSGLTYTLTNPCDNVGYAMAEDKSQNYKCSQCADTGIVDSHVYGSWPCTDCENGIRDKQPEKELSAWDKKLKEELERGDDIWGSISKKYKK